METKKGKTDREKALENLAVAQELAGVAKALSTESSERFDRVRSDMEHGLISLSDFFEGDLNSKEKT